MAYNATANTPSGGSVKLETSGRVVSEPSWPNGGMVTKRLCDYHYDVQQFTGYSTARNGLAQWDRGQLIRQSTPTLRPSGRELFMYDPTKPEQWGGGFSGVG